MEEQKETNDWNSVHFVGGSGLVPVHIFSENPDEIRTDQGDGMKTI